MTARTCDFPCDCVEIGAKYRPRATNRYHGHSMTNPWWRRGYAREPNFADLTEAQRVAVLAHVLPLRRHWDFGLNVFLACWIVGAIAGVAAAEAFDAWGEQQLLVPLSLYILLPVYALALRRTVLLRAIRRATIRAVRDDRLETIRSIIDNH